MHSQDQMHGWHCHAIVILQDKYKICCKCKVKERESRMSHASLHNFEPHKVETCLHKGNLEQEW